MYAITKDDIYQDAWIATLLKNYFVDMTITQFADAVMQDIDDQDSAKKYVDVLPGGTSFQSLDHLLQNCRVDKFEKFDFGDEDKNTEKYGQAEPPLIDLTNINDSQIPVAIFTALHDTIQVVGDSRTVRDII